MSGGWIQSAERDVLTVAAAFGVTVTRDGLAPCPACGQDTRHRKTQDGRAAVGVRRDRLGWRCFQCDASGDAVTLAAYLVTNERAPTSAVRDRLEELGLVGGSNGARIRPRSDGSHMGKSKGAEPVERPAQAPRAPLEGLAELWASCRPAADDEEVTGWLVSRALEPGRVELFDLARALPTSAELPGWARCRGRSWRAGWRLVVPMLGAAGELVNLQARAVRELEEGLPKGANPKGGSPSGAVMADPLARLWLAGAELGNGTAEEEVARVGLVIAEGVPDFLTWATNWSDANEDAPAVLGIVAGSWNEELAERVPSGCRVTLALHDDAAGDDYAAKIGATLAKRPVTLRRWKPSTKGT